ncbi:MAG: hypothetical protein U9532_03765 ['Conium maculatum' witches'-broom phytoplasma]|nr:hypothetical protein ['Conium maculatum' witches'-broom phytoplasma]
MEQKYNILNKESAVYIIKMFKSLATNISRTKRLKESNNSKENKEKNTIECIYRDNLVVYFNSFPSPFRNRTFPEPENNHGKADIIITFNNDKRYIVECFVIHEKESSIKDKTQQKYMQLYDNLTHHDTNASLICFFLKEIFKPSEILNYTEEIIEKTSKNKPNKEEKYQNSDYLFTKKPNKYPEETFYIHLGIYHFYYDSNYYKGRKEKLRNILKNKL